MSILFNRNRTNAAASTNNTSSEKSEKRPTSEFWMNIGYTVKGTDGEGNEVSTFIAINRGIALDDIEQLDESRSGNMGFMNQASNKLLADIREHAANLAPGETCVIAGSPDTLEIQLRRIRDKSVVADAGKNPFLR